MTNNDKENKHQGSEECVHEHFQRDEGELNTSELDAGSKSLADALRISFAVLKIIMVVLVVLFVTSGFFTVEPDERAVVLRLGKIRGDSSEQRILGPGAHWAYLRMAGGGGG